MGEGKLYPLRELIEFIIDFPIHMALFQMSQNNVIGGTWTQVCSAFEGQSLKTSVHCTGPRTGCESKKYFTMYIFIFIDNKMHQIFLIFCLEVTNKQIKKERKSCSGWCVWLRVAVSCLRYNPLMLSHVYSNVNYKYISEQLRVYSSEMAHVTSVWVLFRSLLFKWSKHCLFCEMIST